MGKLQTLEELRTRDELKDYLKQLGKEITEEELDALKQSYNKAQESSGALTLQQLDDVAGGVIFFVCPSKTVGQPGTVSFFNIPKPAVHVDNHKLVNLISPAQFKYLTLGEGEDKKEFCASKCFYMMPTLDYHHVKEKAEFCIYDIRERMGANNHMIFIVDENQENNKLISGTAIVYCGPGISSDAISHKEAKELAQAIANCEPNSYNRMIEARKFVEDRDNCDCCSHLDSPIGSSERNKMVETIFSLSQLSDAAKLGELKKRGLMAEPSVAQYLCPF